MTAERPDKKYLKIVCVGDVHRCWDGGDESAIRGLRPDAVFFVGDYGDEAVDVVEAISNFAASAEDASFCRIAAVLGNHEALWHGLHPTVAKPQDEDSVTRQMKLLDRFNPAFHKMNIKRPFDDVSIVAGRPFSWGGPSFGQFRHIFERYLGVTSLEQSTERIVSDVRATPENNALFFLSHNGPFGLGNKPSDPCGNDYEPGLEDKGDPDLRAAILEARRINRRVPLVVFGHFHHQLQGGVGFRTMVTSEPDGDSSGSRSTVLVNCAFVPRHRVVSGESLHHFMVILCSDENEVVSVAEVWVTADGTIRQSKNHYSTK